MSDFLAQDEQLEMLPARTQLSVLGVGGSGGNGGNGGSANGGGAIANGGDTKGGLVNVSVLSGNAYAQGGDGGHANGGDGGNGGNGHASSYEHKSWNWGGQKHCR
jgi:hypothetical protein